MWLHQVFRSRFDPGTTTWTNSASLRPVFQESPMPGMGELIVILLIVLVVFGANKLPGIGDALGRSIRNFKKASSPEDEDDKNDAKGDKKKELASAKTSKQLEEGEEDGEWEEVVVRRRKKASTAE